MLFRAVLLLLSVCTLPALEVSLNALVMDNHAVVSGRIDNINSSELMRQIDSGGTLRLIWMFRFGGQDETLVRYAHRDHLNPGYVVYSPGRGGETVLVPPDADRLVEALSTLNNYELTALGVVSDDSPLEYRIFLDTERYIPPLSIWSLFRRKQLRRPWTRVSLTQVETR